MKARRLLHILEARDVKLRAEGDRLKWDAPKGIITDGILGRMRAQKTELLALLQHKKADDYRENYGEKVSEETKIEFTPNTIYQGHALEVLKSFPDESIDCVVTSPPYFGLRNYHTDPIVWNGDNDCDHEWTEEKLTGQKAPQRNIHLSATAAFTPTKSAFCIKCGACKCELGGELTPELFISHLCDIFDEVRRVLKPTGTCWVNIADSYSKKDLVGIPELFVLEMKKRGWIRRCTLIWKKPNAHPESCKDRFTIDFEYLYFFTKNKKYDFEQQLESCSASCLKDKRAECGNAAHSDNEQHQNKKRNMRCVWNIPIANCKDAHFAVMPTKLAETPIKAGCQKGGIVLDPFAGIGTTCKMAYELGRKYVGVELNPDFVEMAAKRLGQPNIIWTSANRKDNECQFNTVHFKSMSVEWPTPMGLFKELDRKFGFTLDPCAKHENAKCKKYYTKEEDGLKQDWSGEVVFMNPPYGREIGHWMNKAYQSSLKGATVVCLVPARTDTKWWHQWAMQGDILFVRGRLKFGNSKNSAPFPSAIIVFRPPEQAIEAMAA